MPDLSQPFNALIASNQAQQPNPLAMAGQYAQTKTALAQADDAGLANAQNHINYIISGMTPLLAKGANVTASDVATAGADLVAETKGRISSQEISQFVGQLPQDGPGIQQSLQQHLLRLQSANDRIATLRGVPTETQTGGGTQYGTRNSYTGAYTPQGPSGYVPNQVGPGLTDGPSVMTPSGPQQTKIGNQQAVDIASGRAHVENGRIVYTAPSGGGYQGPAATQGAPQAAPASGGQQQPPVPVGPAPPLGPNGQVPSPGGMLAVGAPAGAAGAADVASQNSANRGQALLAAADAAPQTRATIDNLRSLATKFTSGPYAAGINRAKAGANQLGQMAGVGDVFDPQTIAAQEEFHKSAEMLARQSFAALGGTGTDAQLASAHGANPNDALSGLGNQQILPMLEGLQDAVEAKAAAWQKYRQANGDASYGAFQTDFNRNFSPRAFQFVRMSPEQRNDLVKSMTPVEQKQLGGALQNAEQRGWIKPGG